MAFWRLASGGAIVAGLAICTAFCRAPADIDQTVRTTQSTDHAPAETTSPAEEATVPQQLALSEPEVSLEETSGPIVQPVVTCDEVRGSLPDVQPVSRQEAFRWESLVAAPDWTQRTSSDLLHRTPDATKEAPQRSPVAVWSVRQVRNSPSDHFGLSVDGGIHLRRTGEAMVGNRFAAPVVMLSAPISAERQAAPVQAASRNSAMAWLASETSAAATRDAERSNVAAPSVAPLENDGLTKEPAPIPEPQPKRQNQPPATPAATTLAANQVAGPSAEQVRPAEPVPAPPVESRPVAPPAVRHLVAKAEEPVRPAAPVIAPPVELRPAAPPAVRQLVAKAEEPVRTQPAVVSPPREAPRLDLVTHRSATASVSAADLAALQRQALAHVRHGFHLGGRRALFASRAEFVQSMTVTAQMLDVTSRSTNHSCALREGLKALTESDDFLGHRHLDPVAVDVAAIVANHETPILKGRLPDGLPTLLLRQRYLDYAQRQLALAMGSQPVGSLALHGLAKLDSVLEGQRPEGQSRGNAKSLALEGAALAVDPGNFMAANDLAVILYQQGRWQEARTLLRGSARMSAEPTVWRNLAAIHQLLGEHQQAQLALAEAGRAVGAGNALGMPLSSRPEVSWVAPEAFASAGPTALQETSAVPAASQPRPETARRPSGPRWWK